MKTHVLVYRLFEITHNDEAGLEHAVNSLRLKAEESEGSTHITEDITKPKHPSAVNEVKRIFIPGRDVAAVAALF